MTPLFKKLNYKDHPHILVINAPESFRPEMDAMKAVTNVLTSQGKLKDVAFAMVFATKQKEVDHASQNLLPKMGPDGVVWFIYPKGTSKKYKCEFNRDTGWESVGAMGYEGVRAIAVDEDWSALRFRQADKIKKMTRSFAMTDEGKKKVATTQKTGK